LEEERKLKVKEVLRKTGLIYKKGFKQFIGLSAMTLATVACQTGSDVFMDYSAVLALLFVVLNIASIYLTIRANVSIYLLARNLTQGISMTLKEAFKSSKGHAGTYFAVVLKYALITILPLGGMLLSLLFADNLILKCVLITMFGIPFAFLFIRYYLAIDSALLSERLNGEFESSKKLVQGDARRVLLVIMLTYGLYMIIMQLLNLLVIFGGLSLIPLLITAVFVCALMVFSIPVGIIASVIMYLDLNEIKGVDPLVRLDLADEPKAEVTAPMPDDQTV
jgi:hypothetical protein